MPEPTKWFSRAGVEVTGQEYAADPVKGRASYQYAPPCPRCGGAGHAERWRHTGLTCYQCGGLGVSEIRPAPCYTPEKLAKLDATKAKADAKRRVAANAARDAALAERAARYQAWAVENAGLVADLIQFRDRNDFLQTMWEQVDSGQALTFPQADAAATRITDIRAQEQTAQNSRFFGEEGVRYLGVPVRCTKRIELEPLPRFPPVRRWLHLLETVDGCALKYIGNSAEMPKQDDSAVLDFTVTAHDEYKGMRQAKISRPKARPPASA
jgi:hypothetical protein